MSKEATVTSTITGRSIAITGGAGFIGTALAEAWVDDNQVTLIDRGFDNCPLRYSDKAGHPNLSLVKADILDYPSITPHFAQADIVVHLAAVVGVNAVTQRPRDTMNVNYLGTANVLRVLEEAGHCQRLVYFSTSEVFGANSFRCGENSPASLAPVQEPRWSYAISKLAAEHLVRAAFRETGLPITIIRPFNVFGPKRIGDHALVRFAVAALLGHPIKVHGDGAQIRAWCYIEDLCQAVLLAVSSDEAVGEDFNIGNARNTISIYQLARKVIEACHSPSEIVFQDRSPADIDVRVPCIEKAQAKLGFQPRFELDEGLRRTIDWYRTHIDDLAPIYG